MEGYKLHPLVLINVSDHYTRMKAQLAPAEEPDRVMGCLLGFQTGNREVEICTSFEVKYETVDGIPTFDAEYLGQQQGRYKQVFPKFDVVGWYTTGAAVDPDVDLKIHRSLVDLNESPVFMLFNPKADLRGDRGGAATGATAKDLPISLFESVVRGASDGAAGAAQTVFEPAQYTIETVEAERISVDHVAKMSGDRSDPAGQYVTHLSSLGSAVQMLNSRVDVLIRYLRDVESGASPPDHAVLRAAAALARGLPAANSDAFRRDMDAEMNDTLLLAYLGVVMKGVAEFDGFARRFNAAQDTRGRSRGF